MIGDWRLGIASFDREIPNPQLPLSNYPSLTNSSMQTISIPEQLTAILRHKSCRGSKIGLVPTMGALHDGHMSLVKRARPICDVVVVSIFVNPLQFGPNEDFEKYPRMMAADSALLEAAQVDYLFHPSAGDLYDRSFVTRVQLPALTHQLCARSRPGHFDGVATVLVKLFNIVAPHLVFFGEKDAQQLILVRRLVRDLNYAIEVVACPTVREPDGLALSSRNSYLKPDERRAATAIYRGLSKARQLFEAGERSARRLVESARRVMSEETMLRIDYVELVDYQTLQELPEVNREALLAAAAFVGSTRLIDNICLRPLKASERHA